MRKLAVPATVAALLLTAVAAAPAAGHGGYGGYDRACGDQAHTLGAPWTELQADNVSCHAARNLADVYVSGGYNDDYKGWVCDEKQLGPEDLKVKCKRPKNGGQRLKFFYGA
jgi:opacity protein-like surface antigen